MGQKWTCSIYAKEAGRQSLRPKVGKESITDPVK
jgi:hypothetical protein